MKSSVGRYGVPVRFNRDSPTPVLAPFTEYFQGFDRVEAVRSVFGDRTEEVLGKLRVGFFPNRRMFMGIRDNDGNIAVGTYHLRVSPTRILYLDVIHELFHINQRMKDGKFFHREFMKFMVDRKLYYASPIEIPAYQHTVREAERIGMTPKEITEYLKFGVAPPKIWRNFLKEMSLKKGAVTAKRVTRFPVKIKREVSPELHPFSEYFLGFEKAPAVRGILGESTERFLEGLKVEFVDSPFATIYPSEDDGHLIVASDYFRRGTSRSIYLDAFLCVCLLKEYSDAGKDRGSEVQWGNPGAIRAYSQMVKESRRLRLPEKEILSHLRLPSFLMSSAAYRKFLRALGLREG